MGELTAPTSTDLKGSYCVSGGDVAIDNPMNPSIVKIHLGHSKTDQFSKGVDIYLGKTGRDLCPVSALLAYLAVRGSEPGPLFRLRDRRFLTKDIFITRVRAALTVLGFDGVKYAGHSFRIGAATTAAEVGIEDSTIKMLGRWESSAYQLYVKTSRQTLASISSRLVSSREQ